MLNRYFKSGLFATAIALLAACTPSNRGVHVGNGMTSYQSSYGYVVSYNQSLTLTEGAGGKMVSIDNRKLTVENVSKLEIQVIEETGIKDRAALKEFAELDSKLEVQYVSVDGATAVEGKSSLSSTLALARYLLLPSGALVKFALTAFEAGNGIELLEPIVESSKVDNQGPKITSARWDSKEILAGETHKFYVEAEDDLSGVEAVAVALHPYLQGGKGDVELKADIEVRGALRRTSEGNWYMIEFPVSKYIPSGTYVPFLYVQDAAGNTENYGWDPDKWDDDAYNRSIQGRIVIKNPGKADVTGPSIQSVKLPEELTPGKPFTVLVTATDDVSGIKTGKQDYTLSIVGDRFNDRVLGKQNYEIKKTANENEYEISGVLSHYNQAGKRYLRELNLYDNAGNRTVLWCDALDGLVCKVGAKDFDTSLSELFTKMALLDFNVADVPVIEKMELDRSAVMAGNSVKLKVTLNKKFLDDSISAAISLQPMEKGALVEAEPNLHLFLNSEVKNAAGKDTLEFTIALHEWMPRGQFAISSVFFREVQMGEFFRKKEPNRLPLVPIEIQ